MKTSKKGCYFITIFLVLNTSLSFSQVQKSPSIQTDFRPAQIWSDTNGKLINAHGGGVIFFEGKYYWYGEHKLEGKSEATFADGGIHCYSSSDLINWKDDNGKPFVKMMIEASNQGPEHLVLNLNKCPRVNYFEQIEKDGKKYLIGSGFYK